MAKCTVWWVKAVDKACCDAAVAAEVTMHVGGTFVTELPNESELDETRAGNFVELWMAVG